MPAPFFSLSTPHPHPLKNLPIAIYPSVVHVAATYPARRDASYPVAAHVAAGIVVYTVEGNTWWDLINENTSIERPRRTASSRAIDMSIERAESAREKRIATLTGEWLRSPRLPLAQLSVSFFLPRRFSNYKATRRGNRLELPARNLSLLYYGSTYMSSVNNIAWSLDGCNF